MRRVTITIAVPFIANKDEQFVDVEHGLEEAADIWVAMGSPEMPWHSIEMAHEPGRIRKALDSLSPGGIKARISDYKDRKFLEFMDEIAADWELKKFWDAHMIATDHIVMGSDENTTAMAHARVIFAVERVVLKAGVMGPEYNELALKAFQLANKDNKGLLSKEEWESARALATGLRLPV